MFRGDCVKDEAGAPATRNWGPTPPRCKAYTPAWRMGASQDTRSPLLTRSRPTSRHSLAHNFRLGSNSPELRPKEWGSLIRALYGHPDAGGLWEAHLKKLLKQLGGEEIPEFPGNFFFQGLMLSTYVDDLTLKGPADAHEAFWAKLTKMINVEPPEPIFRVLGRNLVFIDGPAEPQEHDLNAAVSALKGAVAFDMNDYACQTVELFCSITGARPEKLTTPFCPDGSLPPEDDQSAGELAPNACKLLRYHQAHRRLSHYAEVASQP